MTAPADRPGQPLCSGATGGLADGVEFLGVAHRHDAHAAGAGVGLDDDERLLVDAVFLVLAPTLPSSASTLLRTQSRPVLVAEVDLAALRVHRVDEPRVHAQQLGELLRHFLVAAQVIRLAPHRPAGVQRRQQVLLVQAFQHLRHAAGQVVVEQDGAGVEVLQPEPAACAQQRLQHQSRRRRPARPSVGCLMPASSVPRRTFSPAW